MDSELIAKCCDARLELGGYVLEQVLSRLQSVC